jgi:cbb3-type cytochrome oxidase subunit 3
MPNPLFLQVMGISIHEYNSYSPAKKERFQKKAQEKLASVHQNDPKAYDKLTADTAKTSSDNATQAELDEAEDKENS